MTQSVGMNNWSVGRAVLSIILLTFLVFIIFPFLWMIATSFMTLDEINSFPPKLLPQSLRLENFITVFQSIPIGRYYLNSILVTGVVIVTEVYFGTLFGFVFAKYTFRFRNLFFFFVLMGMFIPIELRIIPLYLLLNKLKTIDTYFALIFPFAITGYAVFFMRQFIRSIPNDYIHAGKIDGCSDLRIFHSIVFPLCRTPVAALIIITFMFQWNNFLWPLIVTESPSMRTLQLGIALFQDPSGMGTSQNNILMAATFIAVVPILIVYLFAQRHFISALTQFGIKG